MKALVLKGFDLKPNMKVEKDSILNLSSKQYEELKAVGLVKEATKKQVEDWNKKTYPKTSIKEETEETVEVSEESQNTQEEINEETK